MKRLLFLLFLLQPGFLFAQHRQGDSALYVLPPSSDTLVAEADSAAPPKSPLELEWDEQTQGGTIATTEKVTAGFYQTGKEAGAYGFYTEASRGRVLRVRNLNNDSVVFVKIVSALPLTRAFKGCTLGLSTEAKAALGARDSKAFCEISYAGF